MEFIMAPVIMTFAKAYVEGGPKHARCAGARHTAASLRMSLCAGLLAKVFAKVFVAAITKAVTKVATNVFAISHRIVEFSKECICIYYIVYKFLKI